MDHTDPPYQAAQFATSSTAAGSALTWACLQVTEHGPGWALVPPILLSIASLYGAFWSGRKIAADMDAIRATRDEERARAEEIHQARLARVRAGLDPAGLN